MDIYTFVVSDFIVHDTRALHNDTVYLYYSAFVDGDLVAFHLISIGDVDNGEYSTIDYVSAGTSPGVVVVINDPQAHVAFNFQLVNAGNAPGGSLSARLASSAQGLFGSATGLEAAGASQVIAVADGSASLVGAVWGAALMEAFSTLWSWLSADCDGPLAVDQISGPRYVLDAWTDNAVQSIEMNGKMYAGLDSSEGCGGNSNYELNWFLRHSRTWMAVKDTTDEFLSDTGLIACEHNGAVHAFGVMTGGKVNHARTFTGAAWYLGTAGSFGLAPVRVSAVSFDDRLYLFGVQSDGSIKCLAYTVDGTTWVPHTAAPAALHTSEPVAVAVFRHRLYLLARDSATSQLHITSTSDLRIWNPWANVPPTFPAVSPVTAATLGDRLFVFGVFKTGKRPDVVIMRNSTADGITWSGWESVEAGLRPEEGTPADYPLDVAAGIFEGRVYIVSRWETPPPDQEHQSVRYVAVNFSEDGDDWSGWRIPKSDVSIEPGGGLGLAAVNNHLYLFVQRHLPNIGQNSRVWVY